jgi:hypothetical protein
VPDNTVHFPVLDFNN